MIYQTREYEVLWGETINPPFATLTLVNIVLVMSYQNFVFHLNIIWTVVFFFFLFCPPPPTCPDHPALFSGFITLENVILEVGGTAWLAES